MIIVLVAMLMIVFLGMAALAIDVGFFNQQKRQAQSAADAAALAGAHDLPSTTTATATATAYVASNMSGATPSVTYPTPSQIKVVVTKAAPSLLGQFFGINATVSASAVATRTSATSCATPGTTCQAIFAMDTSCSGVGFTGGGGNTITGAVTSNGALNVGGGNSHYGATTYGTGCTVAPANYQQQSNTFTSGPTPVAPVASWPIDYAALDFPACSGVACTGPLGTPSFCTSASLLASQTIVLTVGQTGQIYCDVGTAVSGAIPGDPSTWTGGITVTGKKAATIGSTYVAKTVSVNGGSDLKPCGYAVAGYNPAGCNAAAPAPATTNYPLVYATGKPTGAPPTPITVFSDGGGNNYLGDIFAPNGTVLIGGGDGITGFIEGFDVNLGNGGITGDGPTVSGGGGSSSGSVALIG